MRLRLVQCKITLKMHFCNDKRLFRVRTRSVQCIIKGGIVLLKPLETTFSKADVNEMYNNNGIAHLVGINGHFKYN